MNHKPITNPELVKAMQEMLSNTTDETKSRMFSQIMKAHFLVPSIVQNIEQIAVKKDVNPISPTTRASFKTITNTNNEKYYMAFTDVGELKKWQNKDQQIVVLTFMDFANFLAQSGTKVHGFVINPMGENVTLTTDMIASLKKQKELYELKYGQDFEVTH